MIELSMPQVVTAALLIAMCSGMLGLTLMAALADNKQMDSCDKCIALREYTKPAAERIADEYAKYMELPIREYAQEKGKLREVGHGATSGV